MTKIAPFTHQDKPNLGAKAEQIFWIYTVSSNAASGIASNFWLHVRLNAVLFNVQ